MSITLIRGVVILLSYPFTAISVDAGPKHLLDYRVAMEDPSTEQGSRPRDPSPVMYLSCMALQDILSQWMEQNAIMSEERVAFQWIFDRHEVPIGVNIWLEDELEGTR